MDRPLTAPVGAVIPAGRTPRRHDIDWLRVLAVLLLYPFHTARIFDTGSQFYVKNAQLSEALSWFVFFLDRWHMPLLFLLAGASSWYALSFRSGRRYASERFKRLLIPFIFGVLVIVPLQPYLGLRNHSDFTGSFFGWLPDFFHLQAADEDGYFLGGHTWGHLWFIFHLFVYSLILLPVMLFLRRGVGKRLVDVLARAVQLPGVILLLAVFTWGAWLVDDIAGGNPFWLMAMFLLGYLYVADERFQLAVDRHKLVALLLGPPAWALWVSLDVTGNLASLGAGRDFLDWYCGAFVPWFFLLAILGYGRRLLSFTNRFLEWTAEGSYALYILHQTVIVAVGFWVVQWDVGVAVKFATILVLSALASAAMYEFLVRRVNMLRFLLGMKMRKRPAPLAEAAEAGTTGGAGPTGLRPT